MNAALRHFRIDLERNDLITVWVDVENRSLNVLFEEVFDELLAVLEAIRALGCILPVLFRSAKQKGFIVGADLRRILTISTDSEIQAFLLKGQKAFECLEQFEQATIAIIQGPCLGGGLEFAMACRFRFAIDDPQTQLGMPEAKIGLMPGWGGTQRLIEIVGLANGLPMLLDGNSIGAKRALEIHMVDALIDPANVEQSIGLNVADFAKDSRDAGTVARYTADSASQVAITKAVAIGMNESRDSGFRAERELFFDLLSDPSVREKLQSFGRKKENS